MKDCSFCKIVTGEKPLHKVYEDKWTLAFAPLEKDVIAKGHMLVVPKKHYSDIYEISQTDLNHIIGAVKIIAQKLKDEYGADGINILHASGKAAQQSVPHFHIHLIPRYNGDGLDLWPRTGYKETNFLKVYQKLNSFF
ncbi:MAG: HIT domain-containing protein [Candidatus Woesearchaeota archaeon]